MWQIGAKSMLHPFRAIVHHVMWLSRCCEKKLLWRRAGDAGGGWCQLPSPPGQQSHWSEHSDELCQRPQCQIFQCTIVFQCTSHTVLMRIEQSTLLFLCGGGGALRQLPAAPSHEGWRGQRKVTEPLFSPFHFSFALSPMCVRARIWHKSSLPNGSAQPIVSILAFTVPFCQHQVSVTFSPKPAPSVFLCCYCLFISLTNSSQAFISALFNIC